MAVWWSLAVPVLVLALAALAAPCQPLFHPPSPAGAYHHQLARENSKHLLENWIIPHDPVSEVKKPSWNVLVGRRGRFRRLFERGHGVVCDEQSLNCAKSWKRQEALHPTVSSSQPPLDPERAQARAILAKYRLPAAAQKRSNPRNSFGTQRRMVPTGPNPLHNSNRSQVIFP